MSTLRHIIPVSGIHITPEGAAVLDWWQELTGQEIRRPGFIHGRQCQTIVETYTREDLELTVRYVSREIAENAAHGRGGLNHRSLTWGNFFGPDEECSKFTDNWNMAKAWGRKRQKAIPAPLSPVVSPDNADLGRKGSEAMGELLRQLGGKKA